MCSQHRVSPFKELRAALGGSGKSPTFLFALSAPLSIRLYTLECSWDRSRVPRD
jgi:hypothetical protein